MKFVVKIDINDEAYDLFKEKYSAEMSDDLFMEVLSIRLGATLSRMSRYLRSHNRCITVERWGTETTAITVEEFAKVVITQLEDRIGAVKVDADVVEDEIEKTTEEGL